LARLAIAHVVSATAKMAEKRKRVVLYLNQKIEIIKRLKKGETATSIAIIYGVGRTTVNDIKRDAVKIEQHVSKMQNIDGDPKTRKTMKSAKIRPTGHCYVSMVYISTESRNPTFRPRNTGQRG
jgi:nicotinic acid phosphoribosyltransferase